MNKSANELVDRWVDRLDDRSIMDCGLWVLVVKRVDERRAE